MKVNNMNYEKHYKALILAAQQRPESGYTELHHIIPRCLGGGNEPVNLVALSSRQHFVAHRLLTKIHPEERGLKLAVWAMSVTSGRGNSHTYEQARLGVGVQISTPKGIFSSVVEAARAHCISPCSMTARARSPNLRFKDFFYTDHPTIGSELVPDMSSKRVVIRGVTFPTVTAAALSENVSLATVSTRCNSKLEIWSDWWYEGNPVIGSEPSRVTNSRQVLTPLGFFKSIRSAASAHSISDSSVAKRINSSSSKWEEYRYVV